jgi:hypothetical protein
MPASGLRSLFASKREAQKTKRGNGVLAKKSNPRPTPKSEHPCEIAVFGIFLLTGSDYMCNLFMLTDVIYQPQ